MLSSFVRKNMSGAASTNFRFGMLLRITVCLSLCLVVSSPGTVAQMEGAQQVIQMLQQVAAMAGQNGTDALAGILAGNMGSVMQGIQSVQQLLPVLQTLAGVSEWDTWSVYQWALKAGVILPLDISAQCFEDVSYILDATFTSSNGGPFPLWTARMIDSFGKIPSGMINGNGNWIGDFKECTDISVYKDESDAEYQPPDFIGEYCLVFIVFIPPEGTKLPEYYPKVGMCFPSTCNYEDKLKLSNYYITSTPVRMAVHQQFCQKDEPRPLDWHTVVAGMFVGCLVALTVAGSLFDAWLNFMIKQKIPITKRLETVEKCAPILLTFSAQRNLKKMFHVEERSDTLGAMHGLRVVTMMWVVFVHMAVMTFQDYPWRNQIDAINKYAGDIFVQIIPGAVFTTDVFLVMSGLLVTYVSLNHARDSKKMISLKLFYFHRLWRLVPPYAVTLAILGGLLVHMGDGPLWPLIEDDVAKCQELWWRNMLFVQNLIGSFYDQCMLPSWYLAVDLQLYLATPLFLYPLATRPRLGLILLVFGIVISSIVPGLLTHIYDLEAYTGKQSRKANADMFTEMIYNKPWNRANTYLIGMGLGYILHRGGTKVTMKLRTVLIGWFFAAFFGLGLLFGFRDYFLGKPMSKTLHVLYAIFARPAFAYSIGWIIYACATGYGGILNGFLSWKALAPFSRLSYSVYLIHILVVHYFYYSRHDSLYIDYYGLITMYFGTLTISVFLAICLSLVAEAPLLGMEKLMMPRGGAIADRGDRATKRGGAKAAAYNDQNLLLSLVGDIKNKTQTESDSADDTEPITDSKDKNNLKPRRRH